MLGNPKKWLERRRTTALLASLPAETREYILSHYPPDPAATAATSIMIYRSIERYLPETGRSATDVLHRCTLAAYETEEAAAWAGSGASAQLDAAALTGALQRSVAEAIARDPLLAGSFGSRQAIDRYAAEIGSCCATAEYDRLYRRFRGMRLLRMRR